jgi:hypothetical protein
MEIFVKAKSPFFVNWLRTLVSEVFSNKDSSSVKINDKEYHIEYEYSDPIDDEETVQLHPLIYIWGHYYDDEDVGKDEERDLGWIEIRSLDDERLQVIFDPVIPEFEKINQEIINKLSPTWQVESLPVDDHKLVILNEDKSKKQKKSNKVESESFSLRTEDEKIIEEFKNLKTTTQKEFRTRYALIQEYREVMKKEYDNGPIDKPPKITNKDIIEYIYNETLENISEQTLYRTKQYGKLGLLD